VYTDISLHRDGFMTIIQASVGWGGVNHTEDARQIQT